jgi:hypothetical protein
MEKIALDAPNILKRRGSVKRKRLPEKKATR